MKYLARLFVFSFIVSPMMVTAEIYKWTDESGRVHFGDAPTTTEAESVTVEVNSFESVEYDDIDFYQPPVKKSVNKAVTMYATSWCGYCKKARAYFQQNNIAFTEYDIETNAQARKAYDKLGGRGVPVILIGKKRLNGFSEKGFQSLYED